MDNLAARLERAKDDVDAGKGHVHGFRDLAHGEGVLDEAVHERTFDSIGAWLTKLSSESIGPTAEAVRAAAKYYRNTEEDAASAFEEKNFPETCVTEIREHSDCVEMEPPEDVGRFEEVVEPEEYLRPVDRDAYDVGNMSHINWWQAFSISSWMNEAYVKATEFLAWIGILDRPYNPLEDLFRPFVGDWAGVYAAADALENLSHALRNGTEEVWRGNAGDGALST